MATNKIIMSISVTYAKSCTIPKLRTSRTSSRHYFDLDSRNYLFKGDHMCSYTNAFFADAFKRIYEKICIDKENTSYYSVFISPFMDGSIECEIHCDIYPYDGHTIEYIVETHLKPIYEFLTGCPDVFQKVATITTYESNERENYKPIDNEALYYSKRLKLFGTTRKSHKLREVEFPNYSRNIFSTFVDNNSVLDSASLEELGFRWSFHNVTRVAIVNTDDLRQMNMSIYAMRDLIKKTLHKGHPRRPKNYPKHITRNGQDFWMQA